MTCSASVVAEEVVKVQLVLMLASVIAEAVAVATLLLDLLFPKRTRTTKLL